MNRKEKLRNFNEFAPITAQLTRVKLMKNRFNLDSLSLCGAKTRSGTSCKRRGNKRNGRCKLHGSNSTGAKTEDGKLVSSQNALHGIPDSILTQLIDAKYKIRANRAVSELIDCMQKSPINWHEVITIVERERIPLEMLKYQILQENTPDIFIVIQSALDTYYQEKNSSHLSFHIHTSMVMLPQYKHFMSRPQFEGFMKRLNRHAPFKFS